MRVSCRDIRSQLTELGFLDRQTAPQIADGESLMDAGVLDSLRLMDLVPELEGRFAFRVAPTDLLPENFESIIGITEYVNTRLDKGRVDDGRR